MDFRYFLVLGALKPYHHVKVDHGGDLCNNGMAFATCTLLCILSMTHSKHSWFLRATAATVVVLAIAILSVCPSHGWISQKWCKLG